MPKSYAENLKDATNAFHSEENRCSKFVDAIKSHMSKMKYRADLSLSVSSAHRVEGLEVPAEVSFNREFGYPEDTDLMALVSQHLPEYQIDWKSAEVDTDTGVVSLMLEPKSYKIAVKSASAIPKDFVSVGTGIYKRVHASTDIAEIWELTKGDEGLSLVRVMDDFDASSDDDDESFSVDQVVATPYGVGKIAKFDEFDNALVQIGSRRRLVAQSDLGPYSVDKEKKKLEQYYAEVYGPEFAKDLVKDYGDAS